MSFLSVVLVFTLFILIFVFPYDDICGLYDWNLKLTLFFSRTPSTCPRIGVGCCTWSYRHIFVRLPWTSDRPVAEASTNTADNPFPPAGFDHAIPTIKRPHTYALDNTATEIGLKTNG